LLKACTICSPSRTSTRTPIAVRLVRLTRCRWKRENRRKGVWEPEKRERPLGASPSPLVGLIDVRVGPKILENLLPLLLVEHQVHALLVVPLLNAALGPEEQRLVLVPVDVAAAQAALLQRLLPRRAEPFEQLIIQGQEELTASRIPLPAGAAGELAVDA